MPTTRRTSALWIGVTAVVVAATPLWAQPAALDDNASSKRRAVECPLPPTLAPLVDDSAAFVSVSPRDAEAALNAMRDCAAANRRDGATWFRFGYLAHLYHTRAEADSSLLPRIERVRLRTEGDSAMTLGLEYAPDSARFWYLWPRVLQHREKIIAGAAVSRWLDRAQKLAEAQHDSALLARIHTERARRYWQDYDARADRAIVQGSDIQPVAEMFLRSQGRSQTVWEYMETSVRPVEPPSGFHHLMQIRDATTRALQYDPTLDVAWRLRYRALVVAGAFEELAVAAEMHRQVAGTKWEPWLALGYAQHRQRRPRDAQAAFDSALAHMPMHERAYWLGPGPILHDSLERKLGALPPSRVLAEAEAVMSRAAPFSLQSANEVRNELLARRVEAELRFAQPELGVRGPESDRGIILVRYGMPDRVATFPAITAGNSQVCGGVESSGGSGPPIPIECVSRTDAGQVTTLWGYASLRQGFVFTARPMFGTARFGGAFKGFAEVLRDLVPFEVSALGLATRVREASAQVVRVRGGASAGGGASGAAADDSLTVLTAGAFPLAHVLDSAVFARVPMVLGSVVTAAPSARRVGVDSTRESVNADGPTLLRRQWSLTVPSNVPLEAARVEAFDPMTGKGATASVALADFETRGRGMSDVILATRVGDAAAERWPTLAPTLAVGPLTSDSLVVAWELYEFANADRWAYDVALELVRRDAGGVRGAIAATLGTLRDLVRGAEVETEVGRVQVAYARARSRPSDNAALEVITLGISALESGTYDVRVTVRDPATGWSATRGQVLEVVR